MTVYLDHAAATAMRPDAREAWLQASGELGNPSSIHAAGQRARRTLEDARERLAAVLDCDPIEIILTSGGTEAINLALKGVYWSRRADADVIVLPEGEHHATLDTVEWLRTAQGARVRAVPVDTEARIDTAAFASALAADTAVATAIVANNEVGTINDFPELVAAAAASRIPLHLDAVAALGHVPLSFRALRGDDQSAALAMSVSAHKIGGPPSAGALVASRAASISALHHGGAAQRDMRAGTQDVAAAVAFATAAEGVERERAAEAAREERLRDRLLDGITERIPEASVLGSRTQRLPGNAHVLFPGAPGESMLYLLDLAGIAVSTGSACQAGIAEPSHVVQAMGRSEADARSVLRFSLGAPSSQADVDAVLAVIADVYGRARGSRS